MCRGNRSVFTIEGHSDADSIISVIDLSISGIKPTQNRPNPVGIGLN
jgi:hypothetical protein